MAKTNDLKDLSEVYGNLGKEATVVAENLEAQTVGDSSAAIGDAELQNGGPTKESGFEESEVDIKKVGDKNPYNIKGLSYGDENCPTTETEQPEEVEVADAPKEEDEEQLDEAHYDEEIKVGSMVTTTYGEVVLIDEIDTDSDMKGRPIYMGTDRDGGDHVLYPDQIRAVSPEDGEHAEEDEEEFSAEALEIAQEGLNKYMANKSIFDKLYTKVINEDFGMEEVDDLDALGIDDATPDDEIADDEGDDTEGEVTITLDKDLAKALHDVLMAAMGEDDDMGDDEFEGDEPEDDFDEDGEMGGYEEDNEGEPAAFNTHYNDGKSNKVGNVGDGFGQPKVQSMNKVHHKPTAGPSSKEGVPKSHSGSYNDGKSNKVGNVPKDGFGKPKVQPMNKSVKA